MSYTGEGHILPPGLLDDLTREQLHMLVTVLAADVPPARLFAAALAASVAGGQACACCGNPRMRKKSNGWHGSNGWCVRCTGRWHAQGRPEGGPVRIRKEKRHAEAVAAVTRKQRRAERVQEYLRLLSYGEVREQAAKRVGISVTTARAYEREPLQEEAAA